MFLHDEVNNGNKMNWWLIYNHSTCTLWYNNNPITKICEEDHLISIHSNNVDLTTNLV